MCCVPVHLQRKRKKKLAIYSIYINLIFIFNFGFGLLNAHFVIVLEHSLYNSKANIFTLKAKKL